LASIGVWNDLDLSWRLIATVDDERCNGCGICVTACASGGYQAIKMENKKACIDVVKCDGCGLCVGVCPTGVVWMRKRE
jgi:dihydropyrimidine dehydrogenase (NAD+) subunit PreA